ncbi:hypothetical protein RhiirA4_538591 [Rhizophagus irregularis]|uniref:Uncharacterized protein n=1 Tax=Rhizophagus irregularis TaxID=588596 RepID=A0A2I1G0F4_9GLOM|nr:hypothetical protein RhiirA4_538591 [Rhizophagus irregularis]
MNKRYFNLKNLATICYNLLIITFKKPLKNTIELLISIMLKEDMIIDTNVSKIFTSELKNSRHQQ